MSGSAAGRGSEAVVTAGEGSARLVIDGWGLDEACHVLRRGGETVRLEPRTTLLLAHLARHPGQVQRREALLKAAWPGVIVGDEALTTAINKLRKAFSDERQSPRIIETIPKMGYRLIARVEFEEAAGSPPCVAPANAGAGWGRAIAFALVVVALAGGVFLVGRHPGPGPAGEPGAGLPTVPAPQAVTESPVILVLPFRNVSDDPDDEYVADGMTEDVITDLSKLSGLRVIASHTALSLKDAPSARIDAVDTGRRLGVDYILDGSMRKAAGQVRINVQLMDVGGGSPLWAERYDRELANIFRIQDEITGHIIEALAIRLTTQERAALQASAEVSFEAYDTFLQGQRSFHLLTREGLAEAISAYREAIRLDPAFGRAYGALSVALVRQYLRGWSEAPQEALPRGLELAREAVALGPSVPQAYWALGYTLLFLGEYEEATRAVEQAIAISPSYADGYGLLALINNNWGRPEDAARQIERAMELNPFYTFDYPYNLGRAYYLMGRYEEAVELLTTALGKNQAAGPPRLYLIASYVRQGLMDDAEWEMEQLRVQSPNASIAQLRDSMALTDHLMGPFLEDLRAAGLPER
ncbi:MAG: winged helix-turn-helix domain-containing protein [Gammaproteobacteria bacterium]|nr:winged helix-turn-helix domain-containing protein [Gammaproteobacteria bacterium]